MSYEDDIIEELENRLPEKTMLLKDTDAVKPGDDVVGKYTTMFRHNGVNHILGVFDTPEEAAAYAKTPEAKAKVEALKGRENG